MIRVGALVRASDIPTQSNNGSYISNAVLLAHLAASYGVELCLFSFGDIDLDKNNINGLFFEDGGYIRRKVAIPPIIDYKTLILRNEKVMAALIDALRERSYFTRSYTGITSYELYEQLAADPEFSDTAVPAIPVGNDIDLNDLHAKLGRDFMLKPENSTGSRGIIGIVAGDGGYEVAKGSAASEFMTPAELQSYIVNIASTPHIALTSVKSLTPSGRPFLIRIHVQRRNKDAYSFIMYPRAGAGRSQSSPAYGGGAVPISAFLQTNFGRKAEDIWLMLETFAKTFPQYYQKFLDSPFFDISFDVGIEKGHDSFRLRLLDVNRFPGFELKDNLGELHLVIAEATMECYKYIHSTIYGDFAVSEQDEPYSFRQINRKKRIWDNP